MVDPTLYWTKVAAIGQVVGAFATFSAVLVSLYLAFAGRRPLLRLRVGERIVVGGSIEYPALLMFEVANAGERPVHIRGIGWQTGWFRWGPSFLRTKAAIQLTGGIALATVDPPYEIQPGAAASSYALMENVLLYSRERREAPLFTRDWPLFGRRATKIKAYAYTADGYTVRVKPEAALCAALVGAEKAAL